MFKHCAWRVPSCWAEEKAQKRAAIQSLRECGATEEDLARGIDTLVTEGGELRRVLGCWIGEPRG
jgi:hypothetical protein